MLQPFAIADATREQYRRYVRTSFPLRDPVLEAQRDDLVDAHDLLWTQPHVSLSRPGATGPALASLGTQLLAETLALPWGFEHLYAHQAEAVERLRASRPGGPASTLVLSGTGSGKTESFLIPIVDACMREPGPGVRAVLIYPMNALANDQLKRLTGLLRDTDVTFGRYTGDAPEKDEGDARRPPRPGDAPANLLWSREAMRKAPPNILITNYLQLELLLLRGRDRELFAHGAPSYLVVDEIHLFSGVLGAEVAALLRRFRQHVGLEPGELTVAGTSATAGSDEQRAELLRFARRFFGAPLEDDALVEEQPAPPRSAGADTPPSPSIPPELLEAAHTDDGLRALATACLGVDLPAVEGDELGRALGDAIDQFSTVAVIERALGRPAPIHAASTALGEMLERAGVDRKALTREAEALILLGSAAMQEAVGEPDGAPRLRPRLHQVVRSLTGLARCLDCERLLPPGATRCPSCHSRALPLASCRSCGAAFWSAPVTADRQLLAAEAEPGEPRRFIAPVEGGDHEDEEGNPHDWGEIVVCSGCGGWTDDDAPLQHAPDCPTPASAGAAMRASDDGRYCPECGASGTGGRDILTAQRGAGAASVAVLTQVLGDELRAKHGDAGGRLLVFADSRQDAGQQAGYSDDQGARIAVRQLIVDALRRHEDGLTLPALVRDVRAAVVDQSEQLRRWLVGESRERFVERSQEGFVASTEDRRALGQQLEWEVVLELTERARRRFSLEGQGIAVLEVDDLDVLVAAVKQRYPDHPFGSDERLGEVICSIADAMRFARAVAHRWLVLTPSALRSNHGLRIGDRAVNATVGFADRKYTNRRTEVDLRAWYSPRGDVRIAKLVGRVIGKSARASETERAVERLVDALKKTGVLVSRDAGGRTRMMFDENRYVVRAADGSLHRCSRCGQVRGQLLTDITGDPLCLGHNCKGKPEPWSPAATRDFYRSQYEAPPRRLVVREHSGQIESDVRLALEQSFNASDPVTVDVLACTPTLEVGVSLDDLNAVMLRNLPPSPANYAQRVGRAGRRSKVALALAHAGNGPHDTYYFERPGELIAGAVKAPAISLDNEPLLRRHLNSLILETLGIDIPRAWVPEPGDPDPQPTIADEEGTIREAVIQPFRDALADDATRRRVTEAVQSAFASSKDPDPPPGIDEMCGNRIASFPEDLRLALKRWCDRFKAIDAERFELSGRRRLTEEERKQRDRLEFELDRLAKPRSPDFLPLGFLGLVGFLPKYGATGERALLSVPGSDAPIDQTAHIAVTEYAPGNLVYARGRRLKVTRLHPRPVPDVEAATEFRENVIKAGRRCDKCGTFTTDVLVKACPMCGDDLSEQPAIQMTGVRGSGAAISGDDEYRNRAAYAVTHSLGSDPEEAHEHSAGGLVFRLTRRREITIANRGVRPDEPGQEPLGFAVCKECGYTEEDAPDEEHPDNDAEVENRGHATRCPARRDPSSDVVLRGSWLIARLLGDVLEIPLGPGHEAPGFTPWRRTLTEALMLGIRETMQAGRRDLDAFEVAPNGEAKTLVIFDTMPGGTGYLPKLLTDAGASLRGAAATALERLDSCDCESSCHRCLRDFWNQRSHRVLDRHAVIPTLRRLASEPGIDYEPEPDELLASFLEREFFQRLEAAGIQPPTLQGIHRLPDGRITVADALYADPDISVYLDGRQYHAQSVERIKADLHRRNQLEERGRLVLEFTYADVMEHFDDVAERLRDALNGGVNRVPTQVAQDGLIVTSSDLETRCLGVSVNAAAWVANEAARKQHLNAANLARLHGWRLHREIANPAGGG